MASPYGGAYAVRYRADTNHSGGKEVAKVRGTNYVVRETERGRREAKSSGTGHDLVALEEIELYAELIIAAERSAVPLSLEAIDRALGLLPTAVAAR
jgi:hypothetical protein